MKIVNQQKYHNFIALQFWIHVKKDRRVFYYLESPLEFHWFRHVSHCHSSSDILLSRQCIAKLHLLGGTSNASEHFRLDSSKRVLYNVCGRRFYALSHASYTHVARVKPISSSHICYRDVYSCTHISRGSDRLLYLGFFDAVFPTRYFSLEGYIVSVRLNRNRYSRVYIFALTVKCTICSNFSANLDAKYLEKKSRY